MAELTKFGGTEVVAHIKHDLRELPPGKAYGNENIDPSLTKENYSLLEGRCRNANEANQYRKSIEKEIFKYKRKNLVHAVEISVQCPSDCPEEQKNDFFRETYRYICSTLPMGERCVFVAQVHKDERKYSPTGELISKDHLHVMYVPGVPDKKHDGFAYKLCADQLTKKACLKEFHPGLQKHLDQTGIHATVYRKKDTDGKPVALSVKQLKELTNLTGIVLDHNLTIEELAAILNTNVLQAKQISAFKKELEEKETLLETLQISPQKQLLKEVSFYHKKIDQKDEEIKRLKDQNQQLHERILSLGEKLKEKSAELSRAEEVVQHLKENSNTLNQESPSLTVSKNDLGWGQSHGWGTSPGWGQKSIGNDMKEDSTL